MRPSDLIQGTLDLLILKALATEARHGWAIAKRIQVASGDVLQIKQGSLYPALHRLEEGEDQKLGAALLQFVGEHGSDICVSHTYATVRGLGQDL